MFLVSFYGRHRLSGSDCVFCACLFLRLGQKKNAVYRYDFYSSGHCYFGLARKSALEPGLLAISAC